MCALLPSVVAAVGQAEAVQFVVCQCCHSLSAAEVALEVAAEFVTPAAASAVAAEFVTPAVSAAPAALDAAEFAAGTVGLAVTRDYTT